MHASRLPVEHAIDRPIGDSRHRYHILASWPSLKGISNQFESQHAHVYEGIESTLIFFSTSVRNSKSVLYHLSHRSRTDSVIALYCLSASFTKFSSSTSCLQSLDCSSFCLRDASHFACSSEAGKALKPTHHPSRMTRSTRACSGGLTSVQEHGSVRSPWPLKADLS